MESEEIKTAICDDCDEEIYVFGNEEVNYGYLGMAYIKCPKCGGQAYIDGDDGIKIDESNIVFPQHFFRFGRNATRIDDTEITKWVKRTIQALEEGDDDFDFYTEATGDSRCIGLKYEDEIEVIVCKDYYEFHLDR